jgi:hypothetical protein
MIRCEKVGSESDGVETFLPSSQEQKLSVDILPMNTHTHVVIPAIPFSSHGNHWSVTINHSDFLIAQFKQKREAQRSGFTAHDILSPDNNIATIHTYSVCIDTASFSCAVLTKNL